MPHRVLVGGDGGSRGIPRLVPGYGPGDGNRPSGRIPDLVLGRSRGRLEAGRASFELAEAGPDRIAAFLEATAVGLERRSNALVATAALETGLPATRASARASCPDDRPAETGRGRLPRALLVPGHDRHEARYPFQARAARRAGRGLRPE